MPLKVQCECGQVLKVPESRAGLSVRCPVCEKRVEIPHPPEPPKPEPQTVEAPPQEQALRSPGRAPGPPPLPKKTTKPPAKPPAPEVEAPAADNAAATAVASPPSVEAAPPPVAADAPQAKPPSPSDADAQTTESHEVETTIKRGVEHSPDKRHAVYWLALGVAAMAAVNVSLAIVDAALDAQLARPTGMAHWAFALLLIGLVQLAYAAYLVQLPDWSTLWVASIFLLVLSAAFAMLLTVLLLGGGGSDLAMLLQLDQFGDDRPKLVCFIMLSLTSLMSYLLGRASVRWHKSDQLLFHSRGEAQTP